jgi:hypothetical protein
MIIVMVDSADRTFHFKSEYYFSYYCQNMGNF